MKTPLLKVSEHVVQLEIDLKGLQAYIDTAQGNETLILQFGLDEMPRLFNEQAIDHLVNNGWTLLEVEHQLDKMADDLRREMIVHELRLRIK